jgi:hypothetical protein
LRGLVAIDGALLATCQLSPGPLPLHHCDTERVIDSVISFGIFSIIFHRSSRLDCSVSFCAVVGHHSTNRLTGYPLSETRYFFLIFIHTGMKPIYTMAAYILTVSPPLSARWRLVASFPLPSARAYPTKKIVIRKGQMKDTRKFSLLFCRSHTGGRGEEQGFLDLGAQPLSLRSSLEMEELLEGPRPAGG